MNQNNKKIALVVDDSAVIRNIIKRVLENNGFEVHLSPDGVDALVKIPFLKPDLITTDVDMPNMDGYELCRKIREGEGPGFNKSISETPIVVITGNDTYGMREKWFDSGATDFIVKPFKEDELLAAVQKALGTGENQYSSMKVLVAEDSRVLRNMIANIIRGFGAQVETVENGWLAWEKLQADPSFDLLLTDFEMPEMNGLQLCLKVREVPKFDSMPVLFLTVLSNRSVIMEVFAAGANDYLAKPFLKEELVARLKAHLKSGRHDQDQRALVERLEQKVVSRNRDLMNEQIFTIHMISGLTENRDPETGKHTQRTQYFVDLILRELAKHPEYQLELGEDVILEIVRAAPLHDIGKIGVPDHILLKPGRLTEEEFEVMKHHAAIGEKALLKHGSSSTFFPMAAQIAGNHHEKWDGSGYPKGLSGSDIPLCARAMALADVYDALTMKRVYKDAMPHGQARVLILDGQGTHFDPIMVDIFVANEAEFIRISKEYADAN